MSLDKRIQNLVSEFKMNTFDPLLAKKRSKSGKTGKMQAKTPLDFS